MVLKLSSGTREADFEQREAAETGQETQRMLAPLMAEIEPPLGYYVIEVEVSPGTLVSPVVFVTSRGTAIRADRIISDPLRAGSRRR